MKKFRNILVGFMILMLIRCVEDPEPRAQEYPIFQTSVGEIDESGITLSIDVLNRGSEPIKQFGFLLGKQTSLDFDADFNISFEDELKGTFSTRISASLDPDQQYAARGYVLVDADTVFGNAASFTSFSSVAPTITDVFPTSGIDGDTITLTGTNFSISSEEVSVSFDGMHADVISTALGELEVVVPEGAPSGNTTIRMTIFDVDASIEGFVVNSPTIESISPDYGFDGTEVTLTGSFSQVEEYNSIQFNGVRAEVIGRSANSITVISPSTSHTGDTNVQIEVNGKQSNPVNFVTGPVIQTVSPAEGEYEDLVKIQGLGFPDGHENAMIKLGNTQVEIISSNTSELEFFVPNITSGNKNISLEVGRKSVVHSTQFNVVSDWKDGASFPSPRDRTISLASGGKGYVFFGRSASGLSKAVFEFDPNTQEWINATSLTNDLGYLDYARIWSVGFAIGDYLYVGGGVGNTVFNGSDVYYDFNRYDPVNNTWEVVARIPERTARSLSFSVNGKGYIGAGFIDSFYEYDPSANEWAVIPNPPVDGSVRTASNTGFSYGGKGYALIGSQLWELDPTSYTWTEKASFPGGARINLFSFVLGDHAYVGYGSAPNNVSMGFKDIYRYDFVTNTWTEVESLADSPAGFATGFVIDNTGYLLAHSWDGTPMYEYTPD